MIVDIQSRPFNLTSSLRVYVQQRLRASIESRTDKIQRIEVRLSDINGPHGGIDKRCHLHLVIPKMADIVIEDTRDNLYFAIDSAITRAREVLDRKLSRKQQRKHAAAPAFQHMAGLSDSV